jgi:hypothetical protein
MWSFLRKIERQPKNNKLLYYTNAIVRELIPRNFFRGILSKKLATIHDFDFEYIKGRVNYYNKLSSHYSLSGEAIPLSEFKGSKPSVYYFDSVEYTRYFDPRLKAKFVFGDVTTVPDEPAIVKSRPIDGDNSFSIVLKLDKVRHFTYTRDRREFVKKKNMLIGRAVVKQPHRVRFYERYFGHPLCDLGQINKNMNPQWIKEKITLHEHLKYKFILCIEGYDVASNLKWVMSSNSLAVMPKPKYETWFMEGRLIPNHHYVDIKDDYSDLEERLNYYIEHTEEALQIIKNANAYVAQFRNKKREDLISLLVLEKYFYFTGNVKPVSDKLVFEISAPAS